MLDFINISNKKHFRLNSDKFNDGGFSFTVSLIRALPKQLLESCKVVYTELNTDTEKNIVENLQCFLRK